VAGQGTSFHRIHQDQAGVDKEKEDTERPDGGRADSEFTSPLKTDKEMLHQHKQHGHRSQEIQVGR
jgi:hypothetical protein